MGNPVLGCHIHRQCHFDSLDVDDFQTFAKQDFANVTRFGMAARTDYSYRANGDVVRAFFHGPKYTQPELI
jgi:hypothetical protein